MIKLGQRLHDERIQRGLSLDEVTQATKIRPVFIKAIEHGEFHKLPASSYAQGFVVNYAEFLGLSKREALALFRREFDDVKNFSIIPERFTEPDALGFSRFKLQYTTLLIIVLFLIFIAYLGYSYRDSFINPEVTANIPNVITAEAGIITISGKASPYDTVTVNNNPVYINSNGTFSKNIAVFPGKVPIIVKATNRFGRISTIERTVSVEE